MTDRPFKGDAFWDRLDAREVEDDLRAAFRERAARTSGAVSRMGAQASLVAVVEQIFPRAAVPATVIAEFIDTNFDKQMGRGDERHGTLPRVELLPAGLVALDSEAGAPFHSIGPERQRSLLATAEAGKLKGREGFDSALWFARLRELAILGYASDPRGMQEMGFPGPSYRPGYLWLGYAGPDARAKQRPGYRSF